MLTNIIIIFCIICLSYVFKMNEGLQFDSQMLFILLAIGVMVLYKFMVVRNNYGNQNNNNNKTNGYSEGFEDNLNSAVSNFAGDASQPSVDTEQTTNHSKGDVDALKEQMEEVLDAVAILKASQDKGIDHLRNGGMGIDHEAVNTSQGESIQEIDTYIGNLKEQIDARNSQTTEKQYKTIPVYNSCVISEADGNLTNTNASSNSRRNNSVADKAGIDEVHRREGTPSDLQSGNSDTLENMQKTLQTIRRDGLTVNLN